MKIYYSNKPMQHVQYLLDKSGTEMNRTEHGKVGNGSLLLRGRIELYSWKCMKRHPKIFKFKTSCSKEPINKNTVLKIVVIKFKTAISGDMHTGSEPANLVA